MTVDLKTQQELYDQIIGNFQTSLGQSIPLLPKAFIRVLAKALAALFVLLYKYGGSMYLQIWPGTAANQYFEILGDEYNPLVRWGETTKAGTPTAAVAAEYTGTVVVNTIDALETIPSGTALLSTSNGVTYTSVGDIALDANPKTIAFRASGDEQGGNGSGVIGNLDVGETVTFVSPHPNVDADVAITARTVDGADAETTEEYRQRVLDGFQKRVQGGAYADYEVWSEASANVINAYPYTGDPGQVDVYCEVDNQTDGIPSAAQLTQIKADIEVDVSGLATQRNANAYINALPITRTAYTVEVNGLSADPGIIFDLKNDVDETVENHFLSLEPYIPGISVGTRNDIVANTTVAGLVSDVVRSYGAVFSSVTIKKGGDVVDVENLGIGEKSKATVSYP
jgi:uncharacterized phage protein gp47/JayE